MARRGVAATTINDITEEADVGFGSFYNYFNSKEEVARIVFAEHTEELAIVLDQISNAVDDPALAVSAIFKAFLERTWQDPIWGWFLLHAEQAMNQLELTYGARARRDLARGVECGRFIITNVDIAATLSLSILLSMMRMMLEKRVHRDQVIEGIDLLLRLYGVAPDEARAIVQLPFPDIAANSPAD